MKSTMEILSCENEDQGRALGTAHEREAALEATNQILRHELEQTRAALQEKEILLKEIHHRIKNNFQVISSLFTLQADQVDDEAVLAVFQESLNRIQSMALVHERLYQSGDLIRINFAEYVRTLAASLLESYGERVGRIALSFQVEAIDLDVNRSIPCGLIVNELVCNALQHGFEAGQPGTIKIGLQRGAGDQIVLAVSDDGCGLPADLDLDHPQSLGLELVVCLVKQLKGRIELQRNGGTRFAIYFA